MPKRAGFVAPAHLPGTHHPEVGWLWSIAEDRLGVPTTASPWTITRDGVDHTMATCGRVLVLTKESFGFDRLPSQGEASVHAMLDTFPQYYGEDRQPPRVIDLAKLHALACPMLPMRPTFCTPCRSSGGVSCSGCGGGGIAMREGIECRMCDGHGVVQCRACARAPLFHSGFITPDRCALGIGRFNRYNLARVLPHLDATVASWAQEHPHKPAVLKTDRWTVVIMPMLGDNRVVPTLDVFIDPSATPTPNTP